MDRIHNHQLHHYYRGDPLELQVLKRDSSRDKVPIGPDLTARERVKFFISGNTSRTARLINRRC